VITRRLVFTLGLAFAAHIAAASDLRNVLTDYTITSWSERDGLPPGNVWALAQDHEGYLWIGSEEGPLRFDGVRFLAWSTSGTRFPERPVRALYVSRDGGVWVGFAGGGGVTEIRASSMRSYGVADGLPNAAVMVLLEDGAGVLWAGGEKGLFRFAADRHPAWTREEGLPDVPVYTAFVDRRGRFHVGTAVGVFRRTPGEQRFEQIEVSQDSTAPSAEEGRVGSFSRSLTEDASGRVLVTVGRFPRSFAEDASGRVLVNDWDAGFHVAGESNPALDFRERGRGYRLLFDSRQNLWVGTIGQGLWRVRPTPDANRLQTERASSLTGLLSDGVGALLEDREGNIWVGLTEGLSRLTPRRITQLTDYGLVVAIETTPDKTVWVGTVDEILRFPPGAAQVPSARLSLHNSRFRTLYADERGTLWVATDRYLARVARGESSLNPLTQSGELGPIDLLASDFRGGVWLYTQAGSLLRLNDGRAQRLTLPPSIRDAGIGVLYTDRQGRLWAALKDGRVAVIQGDSVRQIYGIDDGLNGGVCRQIFEDNEGELWLAATAGLSKFVGGRFVTIRSDHGFPVNDLTAITEDDSHNLWIGSGFGVIRILHRDFDEVTAGRAPNFQFSVYTRSDGLAGLPHAYDSNRRVVRAADGRLWFVTSRGLSLIDPRSLRESHARPPISIEYATADEKPISVVPGFRVPAGISRLEIAYSELNLSPLRTRFRYRLEGFDADWVDAGMRRQAFYTNLPPRAYRFHVEGSNVDGSWRERGATWDFSIAPRFYQTTWFRASGALAIGFALWGLWQLRLHQVRRQFSLLLRERVRLSRELHDTLLQSLVGVALQLDAVGADVDAPSARTRKQFVRLRKQVEEYIREARQSIWDLRSPRLERRDLVTALREAGEHATDDQAVQFELDVQGEPRPCPQVVEEQLLRIGQEAITNAVRHAHATRLLVNVHYNDTSLALRITDDGCGFDGSQLGDDASKHYGLITMRERAEEIGAVLEITSQPHQGTQVQAVLPITGHR